MATPNTNIKETPINTISSASIGNNPTPINLAQTVPDTTASGVISNVAAENANIKSSSQAAAEQAKALELANVKNETISGKNQIKDVLNQLSTQGKRTAQYQEDQQIVEKQKSLDEVSNLIDSQTQGLNQRLADFDKTSGGMDRGSRLVERDRIANEGARRLADLSLTQSVLNRNLLRAQSIVDEKVKLETADLKTRLDSLKYLTDENQSILDKEDQRAFEKATKEAEREYQDKLYSSRLLGTTKLDLAQKAASQGAPSSVLVAIQNAETPEAAVLAAGKYSGDILDRSIKQAQLDKVRTEASILAAQTGGKSDDLSAYANQYSDTGKLPSPAELRQSGLTVGQVVDIAKQSPKPDGALVSINTGVKTPSLSSAQEEGLNAMSQIVRTTIPALKDKFPKLFTGVIGGVGGALFTSQDRQDYLTFRQEFLNKLLKARSGAAVNDKEYERYSKLLPTTFNQPLFLGSDGLKKLNALETEMKRTLDNELANQQLAIYGYSKVRVPGDTEGMMRTVGEVLDIGGTKYRVLPDGSLTDTI